MKIVISLLSGYVDVNGESVGVSPGVIKIVEIESVEKSIEYGDSEVFVRSLNGVKYSVIDWKLIG